MNDYVRPGVEDTKTRYTKHEVSRVMAQAVSRRPLAEARVRVRFSPCGFVVGKMAVGEVSPLVIRLFPVSITPSVLHAHIFHLGDEQ
jgi:hypothetical protein